MKRLFLIIILLCFGQANIGGYAIFDYKNIRLLRKYITENGKIMPSRITSVCQKKQRELSLSIKRARNLALI